jgi:hypothetical protein
MRHTRDRERRATSRGFENEVKKRYFDFSIASPF